MATARVVHLFSAVLLVATVPASGQQKSTVSISSSREVESYSRERSRAPWGSTSDTTTIPFVISASGGISLGSYQAGVTWALGRLTRYLADNADARRSLALGRPNMLAATGASAGNINAVLSALEWCAAAPRLPEESLFWRIWVNVGWPELFPPDGRQSDTSDFGVFDRRYFKNTLFRDIETRMQHTRVRAEGCNGFALGVTATRLDPSDFPVTDQLTAVTQRYAATFQLAQPSDTSLVFVQADSVLRTRSLGEMLALNTGRSNVLTTDTLFKLIEASSSFPIAFSPRKLRYYPASSLRRDGTCPREDGSEACLPSVDAWFTDGGVFDNNPLGLAFDMYERLAPSLAFTVGNDTTVVAVVPKTPPRALYVGTDDFRRGDEKREIDRGPVGGVDAIRRLILGAVPAAREYEMQTLARSIADGHRVPPQYIRVTTRYFPLFGEHVMAFGAFFGRPMREWDFYVGVYDGLVFAARDVVCKPRDGFDLAAEGGEDACVRKWTRRLMSGSTIPLGPIAPTVLSDMWAEEFHDWRDTMPAGFRPAGATSTDSARLLGLRWLTTLQVRQLRARDSVRQCGQIDWADRFLCNRNLDRLLNSIRENQAVWDQYQAWSKKPPCLKEDTTATLDNPCLADRSFVNLVRDPARELKNRVGEVLHRMWEVETDLQRRKRALPKRDQRPGRDDVPKFAPPHDGLVEFAEMTLRSIDWPAREGRDLDPSSIPPNDHGTLKRVASLVPYQISIGASGRSHLIGGHGTSYSGFDIGWQPTFHLGDRFMLQAPTSLTRWSGLNEPQDSTAITYLRGGFGGSIKLGGFKAQSIGVAVRPSLGSIWSKRDGFHWQRQQDFGRMIGAELTIQGIAGKGRLTAYYTGPRLEHRDGTAGRVGVMIGITDLPGIAYWLVR